MTDRDERPLWLRTKFTLGAIGMVCILLGVWIGWGAGKLDSNSLAAAFIGISALGSVTTYMQGRSDEKRGG